MSADEDIMTAIETPATIDPFSFHIGSASRIAGLGGPERPPANDYVFHTPYVEAASGNVHFIARFVGLQAKRGTLQLRVHMLPEEPGAAARVANSERISLSRLIKQGGEIAVRFEGFRGVRFALHGTIADDTDAIAESLIVLLDRPAGPDDGQAPIDVRSTTYGRDAARPVTMFHALRTASLASPSSQPFTAAQLEEPGIAALSVRLGMQRMSPTSRWSNLFLVRALDAFGFSRPGARGLGLGIVGTEAINELLRAGCDMTVIGFPLSAEKPTANSQLHYADPDPAAIGNALSNFDFVCSIGATGQLTSIAEKIAYIEQSLKAVRPGGFAVHALPFLPRHARGISDPVYFDRNDVERLALILISRGHQVAQLLLDGTGIGQEPVAVTEGSVYGLVAQRAPSAF